jgi:hypothetical protein
MKGNRIATIGVLALALLSSLPSTFAQVNQQSQIEQQQLGLEGPSGVPSEAVGPAVPGVAHTLLTTYIHTCIPNCSTFALPAGTFVPLDAVTTINCAAPLGHTCTITLQAWIQTQNTSSTGNNAGSVNMLVDGRTTPTYFGGDSPPNAFFYDGLFNRSDVVTGVSRGTHTVRTQARSEFGANGGAWTAIYSVYTP